MKKKLLSFLLVFVILVVCSSCNNTSGTVGHMNFSSFILTEENVNNLMERIVKEATNGKYEVTEKNIETVQYNGPYIHASVCITSGLRETVFSIDFYPESKTSTKLNKLYIQGYRGDEDADTNAKHEWLITVVEKELFGDSFFCENKKKLIEQWKNGDFKDSEYPQSAYLIQDRKNVVCEAIVTSSKWDFGDFFNYYVEIASAETISAHQSTAEAQEGSAKKDSLVKDNVLTVAVAPVYSQFLYKENGKITGFETEITELVARKLGLTVEFCPMEAENLLDTLSDGRADVAIGCLQASKNTESDFVDFSEPYFDAACIENAAIVWKQCTLAVRTKSNLLDKINTVIQELRKTGEYARLKIKYNLNDRSVEISKSDFNSIQLPMVTETKGKSVAVQSVKNIEFSKNQATQDFIYSFPPKNASLCFMRLELYIDNNHNHSVDDGEEMIYQSGLGVAGYSLTKITLTRALEAGEYDVVLLCKPYSYDQQLRPLNQGSIYTTITVR